MTELWQDENYSKTMSNMSRSLWQNPVHKEKMLASYEQNPNGVEGILIETLKENDLYAENRDIAQQGQIYYTGLNGNSYFSIFKNESGGVIRRKLPDFKVKGQKKVIEIFGDYWHSKVVIRQKRGHDFDYKPKLLIQEYARVGVDCKIYWESEIRDRVTLKVNYKRLNEIVHEIKLWITEPVNYN